MAIFEILLCSSVPTQLAIGAALRAIGIASTDSAGHLSLLFVMLLSLIDTTALVVIMAAIMRAHGERPSRVWLGASPTMAHRLAAYRWREAAIGLATVPLVFLAVGILLNTIRLFAPGLHNVKENPLEQLAGTPQQAALFSLVAIVAGGVREELQRAFLLHRFEQALGGGPVGVAVTSVAFGAGHLIQGVDAAIATGLLGAFWGTVYLRRRSAIAPMVSHAGFDLLQIVQFIFVKRL